MTGWRTQSMKKCTLHSQSTRLVEQETRAHRRHVQLYGAHRGHEARSPHLITNGMTVPPSSINPPDLARAVTIRGNPKTNLVLLHGYVYPLQGLRNRTFPRDGSNLARRVTTLSFFLQAMAPQVGSPRADPFRPAGVPAPVASFGKGRCKHQLPLHDECNLLFVAGTSGDVRGYKMRPSRLHARHSCDMGSIILQPK